MWLPLCLIPTPSLLSVDSRLEAREKAGLQCPIPFHPSPRSREAGVQKGLFKSKLKPIQCTDCLYVYGRW